MAEMERWSEGGGTEVQTTYKPQVKKPNFYRVVLLNDDFTPMEFVIWLLQVVFHKSEEESARLMLEVHTKGRGICGVYPYDVARTKVFQVQTLVEKHEHPLQCVMEVEG